MENGLNLYCHYSDLPSPWAYAEVNEDVQLSTNDIDRIIEMAWEDRTPFDAIKFQFNLSESEVKKLMKDNLKLKSYKSWRQRVELCKTKHLKKRLRSIGRFKSNLQRHITSNKISKR